MAKKKTSRYQIWCYSENANNDAAVFKAAGLESFGSGSGFGKRDVSFFAPTKDEANNSKDRLLKVKGVISVDVIDEKEFGSNHVKTYWAKKP